MWVIRSSPPSTTACSRGPRAPGSPTVAPTCSPACTATCSRSARGPGSTSPATRAPRSPHSRRARSAHGEAAARAGRVAVRRLSGRGDGGTGRGSSRSPMTASTRSSRRSSSAPSTAPERAAAEIARVLRPGGELRLIEHVRDPDSPTPRPVSGPARAPLGLGRRLVSPKPRHRCHPCGSRFRHLRARGRRVEGSGPLVKPLIAGRAIPPSG